MRSHCAVGWPPPRARRASQWGLEGDGGCGGSRSRRAVPGAPWRVICDPRATIQQGYYLHKFPWNCVIPEHSRKFQTIQKHSEKSKKLLITSTHIHHIQIICQYQHLHVCTYLCALISKHLWLICCFTCMHAYLYTCPSASITQDLTGLEQASSAVSHCFPASCTLSRSISLYSAWYHL
jgi:hypothetical protein